MNPAMLSLIELAVNTLLSLFASQGVLKTDFSGLAQLLESAIAPLMGLFSSGKAAPASQEVLAAYAAIIGVLNALRTQKGLPTSLLAKIDEYILGAQDGTTAYLTAGKGFDPAQFEPVQPMPPAAS